MGLGMWVVNPRGAAACLRAVVSRLQLARAAPWLLTALRLQPPTLAAPPRPAGRQISDLPARELLPGDIVEIHTGDRVPADIRIVQVPHGGVQLAAGGAWGMHAHGSSRER